MLNFSPSEHAVVASDVGEICHRKKYRTVAYCIDRILA